jgi:uncharacterized cupredoxin-like copper-binding protein
MPHRAHCTTTGRSPTRATSFVLLTCAAAALAITACGQQKADVAKSQPADATDHTITVTATDYAFDAPAEIPSGITTMRLVNNGHELHHVQLVRLTDGKTAADLSAALKQPGPPPPWMQSASGPNAAPPGSSTQATFMLAPGNYAMLCMIPGPDHTPHFAKGMVRPLTVSNVANASSMTPTSDVTINMTDYAFSMSPAITAGPHTLQIVNQAKQDHEAVLVRLAPGKKAMDVAAWVDNQTGPPPGEPLGGVTGLATGASAYITADFTPGTYALLCFLPDAKDGKPHVVHGMVQEFTI